MKNKKIIWIAIGVCVLVLLIPNILYIIKFYSNTLSNDPAVWGQYGDYLGGSINPILSVFNIIALVYLTYTVSHVEDNRATENIVAQKIIMLNQMRHNAVVDFTKGLTIISTGLNGKEKAKDTLGHLMGIILFFRQHNEYLFKELFTDEFDDKYPNALMNSTSAMIRALESPESKEAFGDELNEYMRIEQEFISELNKFILKDLSSKKLSS